MFGIQGKLIPIEQSKCRHNLLSTNDLIVEDDRHILHARQSPQGQNQNVQILPTLRRIILCLEVLLVGGHVLPKGQGESVVRKGVSLEAFLDGCPVGIGILPFHKPDRREDQLGHVLGALGHTVNDLAQEKIQKSLEILHLRMFRDQSQMLQALQSQPEGDCCKQ